MKDKVSYLHSKYASFQPSPFIKYIFNTKTWKSDDSSHKDKNSKGQYTVTLIPL